MRYWSCSLAALLLTQAAAAAPGSKMLLRQNWTLQSSADVHENGAALSSAGFRPPRAWHPATLPTTVFSALVAAGVYPDPYFGTNLRSAPGVSYNIGFNFSNAPMPEESPFRKPWWFRTEFKLPAEYTRQDAVAEFRRHQLPRQRLAQRQTDRHRRPARRGVAPLRIRRHRCRQTGRRQRTRHRDLPARTRRSRHHLRRLEPHAARQGHGTLARCLDRRHRARRHPLSLGHHAPGGGGAQLGIRAELVERVRARRVQGVLQRHDREAWIFAARATGRARNQGHSLRAAAGREARDCGGPRRWVRRTCIRST